MYGPGGQWGEGGLQARPKFSSPHFWGQQEKIWAKPVFKDVFIVFVSTIIIFFMFDVFFIFIIILLFFMFLKFYPEVGVIFKLHSHETVVD